MIYFLEEYGIAIFAVLYYILIESRQHAGLIGVGGV